MTKAPEEVERPAGSLDALRAELDELRQRVVTSDEEIDLLQVDAARNKRKWYRDPSVLVAALALAASVVTFVVGQVNVTSDRQIQDRNRLYALIEQLPPAEVQLQEKPGSSPALVVLIADSAAALLDKLGPEASTAPEKIEVAFDLVSVGSDLPSAKRLAIEAEQQTTNTLEKIAAARIIANIDFQAGDAASGRTTYQRIVRLIQTPQKELDAPLLRDNQAFYIELSWATDEFSLAKNCQGAAEQLENAKQALNRQPPERIAGQTTALNNVANMVATRCPTGVR
jgi:hypothetical protein